MDLDSHLSESDWRWLVLHSCQKDVLSKWLAIEDGLRKTMLGVFGSPCICKSALPFTTQNPMLAFKERQGILKDGELTDCDRRGATFVSELLQGGQTTFEINVFLLHLIFDF